MRGEAAVKRPFLLVGVIGFGDSGVIGYNGVIFRTFVWCDVGLFLRQDKGGV